MTRSRNTSAVPTLALGSLRSGVAGVAVALVIALVPTSTYSQSRGRQIDGSTKASFEASVALLQNQLRSRHREDFERALAVIWMGNTVGTGDFDRDSDVDDDDARFLGQDARDLLTDIQRGNLLSAIEKRERNAGGYTAAAFIGQLDGLGYDEVLELAGRPSEEPFLGPLRQLRSGLSGPGVLVDLCGLVSSASVVAPDSVVPIVRVAPRYPQRALEDGLSGAVCLEFAVERDGTPKDIVVLGSTSTVFERPALAAFARWKYPPGTLVGERWRTQIGFQL